MNYTQKELYLLKDQKHDEELCIKKYNDYSSKATDPTLSKLFSYLAKQEKEHLKSINQLLNGSVPQMPQPGQQPSQQQMQKQQENMEINALITQTGAYNQQDSDMCSDSLNTEKYVSGFYNTSIFEFRDKEIRKVLNHIQKEEQEHGEKLYNYMQSHNMYNLQ